MKKEVHHHYRIKRRTMIVLSAIVLAIIYLLHDASFILRAVSMVAFILLFYGIDHYFDIRFKPIHYVFIIIIGIASLLLSPLYFVYPQYDKFQHFLQPILICSIIYHMVSLLNLELKWKLTFAFFITIGILGMFEIGEYALDLLFDWKLQGVYLRDITGIEKFNILVNPIDDTMMDLALGVLGTCIYGLTVFIYLRKSHRLVFRNELPVARVKCVTR